jgi:hypothetical protein
MLDIIVRTTSSRLLSSKKYEAAASKHFLLPEDHPHEYASKVDVLVFF